MVACSYDSIFAHKTQYFVRTEDSKQNLKENSSLPIDQALANFQFLIMMHS